MGGRGASSGRSAKGNKYGSQYKTLLKSGNIKFVEKNSRTSESLLETMTNGRVYVTVGGGKDLLQVIYFDTKNKKSKSIDLTHRHNGMNEHVHHGYFHNELDGAKGAAKLSGKEKAMVDRNKKFGIIIKASDSLGYENAAIALRHRWKSDSLRSV